MNELCMQDMQSTHDGLDNKVKGKSYEANRDY